MTVSLLMVLGVALLVSGWLLGRRVGVRRDDAETARLRAELSRKISENFSLQELSYVLSDSLHLDRIAGQVTAFLRRFFDAGGSLIALIAETPGSVRIAAAEGTLAPLAGRDVTEAEAGLLGAAMGREQIELAERDGTHTVELIAGVPVERAAVVPLRAHGMTVGAIAVVDRPAGAFSGEELRLLSTVATHAAIVLSNARFFDLVRAGRDQWETTFNALAEGIAVVDQDGVVRRANRALAEMTRDSVPALSGTHICDALPVDSAELLGILDTARRGAQTPARTLRADRLRRVLRVTAAPLRGVVEPGWVVTLVEDVTEQDAIESQLIQHEKMAAVGQLVSGVAHELNNPLTSIAGLAEFLLEQPEPSERDRDHVRVIREQADRAGRIVRNLLTFARKGPADIGPIDLNDVVQRTAALVGYELTLREVRLETALDASLPTIHGDRYQIQQVVLNLVTNAVHAVDANPPDRARHIHIRTATAPEGVTLSVADTGPGIPEEILPQIFTPFFTTKEPGRGTGLGLSISYRIVEGHGGHLVVRRGVDGGAVFQVHLPVGRATRPVAPPAAPAPSEETADASHEVLLVDDDPAVRRMIEVLLAAPNRRIEAARDAMHAVELLGRRTYDLLIADPRAAVSAGERFGDRLVRSWPELKARTILVTADVRPETDVWLQQLGCRYFRKPFRIAEIKQVMAEILAAGTRDG